MRVLQKRNVLFVVLISVFFLSLGACSSTATTSSTTDDGTTTTDDGTTGAENTVTLVDNNDVIENTPSPDPSSMDYAVSAASSSISALVKGRPAYQMPGATEVGCMTDALNTLGVQAVRQLERMSVCKVRGLWALAETNDSLDLSLEDGGEVYVQLNPTENGFSSSTQLLKVVHVAGDGFGTIRAYQCSQSEGSEDFSQIGFLAMSVDTSDNNKYTVNTVFRRTADECVQAQTTRTVGLELTDVNFEGITTLNFDDSGGQGTLILSADGARDLNVLQGKHLRDSTTAFALADWDTDSGCANATNGSQSTGEIPFSLSTAADGSKTYSSNDSVSDCDALPTEPDLGTCPEFAAIEDGAWDCDTTGQTVVELFDASDLEDAGGERCQEMTDAFSEDVNPDDCFEGL